MNSGILSWARTRAFAPIVIAVTLSLGITGQSHLQAEPASLHQFYGPCTASEKGAFNHLIDSTYGRPYLLVRQQFIAAGWYPAPLRETSRWRAPPQPPYVAMGMDRFFIEKGYNELDSCAVDRDAPCDFLFRNKRGDEMRVSTNGEEYAASHAKVGFMMLACPPAHLP